MVFRSSLGTYLWRLQLIPSPFLMFLSPLTWLASSTSSWVHDVLSHNRLRINRAKVNRLGPLKLWGKVYRLGPLKLWAKGPLHQVVSFRYFVTVTGNQCLCNISCCYAKISWQKQHKEERAYHGSEVKVIGAWRKRNMCCFHDYHIYLRSEKQIQKCFVNFTKTVQKWGNLHHLTDVS